MTDTQQDEQLHTVRTLAEALPYMRRFTGQTFVIKYGGHAMGDAQLAEKFARDVVLMKQVGIHPVVVHGGGPQIGAMLDRLKIKSSFIDGLRVTDSETVDIGEMVLSGSINKAVVTAINSAGGTAVGISGKDGRLIEAAKLQRTTRDPDSNIENVLDLGFVGEPVNINPKLLETFVRSDKIPVIATIGVGEGGETYNINADTAAGTIARSIKSRRLMLLTDIDGVLDNNDKLISEINTVEAQELINHEVIHGGMIPKVKTCIDAINNGVRAVVIIDGRKPHSILFELFSDKGAGTLIRK